MFARKRLFNFSTDHQPSSSATLTPTIKKYRTKCPANRNAEMFLNPQSADVHFSFGSTDSNPSSASRIPAHKNLLATDSDVFKAIFAGKLKEVGGGDIIVTEVSDAVFKDFLKFFYLSEVEVHAKNIAGLMNLGFKYNVTNCINVCVNYLKDSATAENILITLGLAIRHNHSELTKICGRFIMLNTNAVLESSGFVKCERQTLAHMINENLLACSDVKVFEACMAWVKAKGKQNELTKTIVDEHLGDLFYEIRFGSMTHREFCKLAEEYDAVLSNDFKTITNLITLPNFQPEKFNVRPRCIKLNDWGTKLVCNRLESEDYGGGKEGFDTIKINYEERTVFSTNKPLYLIGLTCVYGEASYSDDDDDDDDDDHVESDNESSPPDNASTDDDPSKWTMSIKMEIAETRDSYGAGNATVLMSTNVKVTSQPGRIPLPWPVFVKPGFLYQISISPYPDSLTYEPMQLVDDAVRLRPNTFITFRDYSEAFNDLSERMAPIGIISKLEFINVQDN